MLARREPGRPHAREEAAGQLRPAEQRGRAGATAASLSPTPRRSSSSSADLQTRQGGHARHAGGLTDRQRAARAVQVPGLGGAPGGRHGRTRGLQRACAPRSGTRRASRSACCRSWRRPGRRRSWCTTPSGNGYKMDYQAVLGGGEPGKTVRPDSVPVLRIGLKSGQGGYGREPRLARVRRRHVRRAGAAGREGVRPQRLLRRAAERHGLAGAGPREPGGLARAERHVDARARRTSTPSSP